MRLMGDVELDHVMGRISRRMEIDQPGRVASTRTPFKRSPGGIRPGGRPRWLELLIKHAAILDSGAQSQRLYLTR